MKKILLKSLRVFNLLSLAFVTLFAISINGQNTVTVSSNRSGDIKIAQKSLPVLNEEPLETLNKVQTKRPGQMYSVLSGKPKGEMFKKDDSFFCSTPNAMFKNGDDPDTKAVGSLDCGSDRSSPCYWDKPIILIGFIDGTPELKKVVNEVIAEWTTWANIAFIANDNDEYEGDKADIKILFNTSGYSSNVGIDAWHPSVRRRGKNSPTMNLGFVGKPLRYTTGEILPSIKGTILHEFGHALGLQHEHQNPAGGIQWNKDAVVKELSGPPNNWDANRINLNIFQALSRRQTQFTNYDASSVMHYSFPAAWTLNNVAIPNNDDLSETDKAFIARVYPRQKVRVKSNQHYQLSTWYSGGKHCLAVGENTGTGTKSYFPYFADCDKNSSYQQWKFTSVGNGDYRITNKGMGEEVSVNDVGLEYFNEFRKTGNYSGQHWTITNLGKYSRLTSSANGISYSLTAKTEPNSRTYMSKTAHWANQLWDFVPVETTR